MREREIEERLHVIQNAVANLLHLQAPDCIHVFSKLRIRLKMYFTFMFHWCLFTPPHRPLILLAFFYGVPLHTEGKTNRTNLVFPPATHHHHHHHHPVLLQCLENKKVRKSWLDPVKDMCPLPASHGTNWMPRKNLQEGDEYNCTFSLMFLSNWYA